ncbi:MAG TPA: DUF2723 domain-containing protein [Candidatus Goldiibacteriota bacterium]|nr:DUF2723 domain-containing protein [Candidatus Goldiibacteriota bacterium]
MQLILAAISLALMGLYIITSPPTIYFGDSGELAAAAYNLGIGHPPGYPLFTLMEKLFSLIPAGDIAFRMNLMSGFFGVLVFLLIYLTVKEVIKYTRSGSAREKDNIAEFTSILTGLIYVLSAVFWEQCLNIKGGIYTMAHFGYMLAIFSFVKYAAGRELKWFYLLAFTCGLLPVLHQTTLVLVAAAVVSAFILGRKRLTALNYAAAAGILLFMLVTPYIYMFIRNYPNSSVVWFEIRSFENILNHILRKSYLNLAAVPLSLNSAGLKTSLYLQQLFTQYNVFVIFMFFGFFALFKKNKTLFFTAAGFILVNYCALIYFTDNTFSPVFIYVNRAFYLLNDMILVTAGGLGLYFAVNLLHKKQGINSVFSLSLVSIIPLIMLLSNFQINNHSRKFFAYDHAVNILKSLKPGDIFFSKTDQPSFNIQYLRFVKNKYTDIKTYDGYGNTLDMSIYSHIPRKKLTSAAQKEIETKIVLDNPGRVYNFDMVAYPELNLYSAKYGIMGKILPQGMSAPGDKEALQVAVIRDYYFNHKLDYFYRETMARYFCRMAQYAMRDKDTEKARMYLTEAEHIARDSAVIIKLIASVYFYEAMDLGATVQYLEKAVLMNSYDFSALRLMVFIYSKATPPAVPQMIKWMEFEYKYQSDAAAKAELSEKIRRLRSGEMINITPQQGNGGL